MNWKEFLRPDWGKIIFILFILTFSLLSRLIVRTGPFIENLIFIVFMPSSFLLGYVTNELPFVVINITYWYLISCLIVWIYDKKIKKR